ELAEDGVTLRGSPQTILTNDRGWEGALVEGQWMVERDGFFYLFYSANGYASASYAVGVARATSPTGPFTKAGDPILVTNGAWGGPGHGSIVTGPRGETVHVYHAWQRDRIGMSPGRQVLVDRVTWRDGWPAMLGAPSRRSQPMP
ncbi:MAG: family 43 glycosylhydrolase, partial [Polyangiales bacterium]